MLVSWVVEGCGGGIVVVPVLVVVMLLEVEAEVFC